MPGKQETHCREILRQDGILTREAGWEGGFLGQRNKGVWGGIPGPRSQLLKGPVRPISDKHRSVSEAKIAVLGPRWWAILSGMGLPLASAGQDMRQGWLKLKAAGLPQVQASCWRAHFGPQPAIHLPLPRLHSRHPVPGIPSPESAKSHRY